MPDGGLYDQIKQFLPVAADAAIGGLIGGPAGAIAGAAGGGQAEYRAQEFGQQQQDKMMQVMSLMEERKARIAEAQERTDLMRDLGHQRLLIEKQNADTNQWFKGQSIDVQKDRAGEIHRHNEEIEGLRRIGDALAGGKNITDSDWDIISKANPEYAGIKSPKARELVGSRLLAAKGAATDAAMDAAWGTIAKSRFGGDVNAAKTDPMLSSYTPHELVTYAHRLYSKDTDPAAFKKEMDGLTANLEAAHEKWRSKDAWLKGALSSPEAEAKGTLKYLKNVDSMSPEEVKSAEAILTKGFAAKMKFGDIAKLIHPKVDSYPTRPLPDGATSKDASLHEQVLKAFADKGITDPEQRRKMLRDMGLPEEWATAAKAGTSTPTYKTGDTREIGGVTYKRDDKGTWNPVK